MKTIGVIGSGQMGRGIAQVAAQAGYHTLMSDIELARAEAGKAGIEQGMMKLVARGKLGEDDVAPTLARLTPTADLADFSGCDLIIEAATEAELVKREIFAQLTPKDGAVLATNTSSISITGLAAQTERPDRFLGLHFFNPVPAMKLVEIIPGLATSDETLSRVRQFCEAIGKLPIEAEDRPAFIVNRILCPMMNEAIFALGEGAGSVKDIDQGLVLGANHPMGPLTLADFVGLDTLFAIMQVMQRETGDQKYRPAPLLTKYVEAGWLGRKSGRGFYDYSCEPPQPTR
ncbi:MAG: 3-hydroxyacyl-CoA dehydrogenase NAD-binding domain-containing protein [Pseudomonadota bacterium]